MGDRVRGRGLMEEKESMLIDATRRDIGVGAMANVRKAVLDNLEERLDCDLVFLGITDKNKEWLMMRCQLCK